MRINNLHLSRLAVDQAGQPQRSELVPVQESEGTSPDVSFHTPSAEWAQWLSLALREPEVRGEVVERVAVLVAEGYYLTAESAARTAHAILAAAEE